MENSSKYREHKKRPIIVLATLCFLCLYCVVSCPTKALY
ncbi:MAG: 4Fe-4S binding protein [Candidatus Poseidoniaceae archaeon]|nr:4Fe-4S binding protein [Candidatus Poseidoniaceae archaeon]MBL6889094.1 4Fe-4S binding protein [Candidatus Poseidoniaceae archaeon]